MRLIDADALEKAVEKYFNGLPIQGRYDILAIIANAPTADVVKRKHEPLTDEEQRIFLAAMGREEMICKKVDVEMRIQPYEVSLVLVCSEIERKVKKALWTN